jgi:hypothetical protein
MLHEVTSGVDVYEVPPANGFGARTVRMGTVVLVGTRRRI